MSRLIVGPFNRVEGDLEVTLDIAGGAVKSARVNATLYRGFEQILRGKAAHDALIYVPRICGICSVSQSVAAALALQQISGVIKPPNGQHATNLILAVENLADHLSHFYLFFMPDFARTVYQPESWHAEAARRFTPETGEQIRKAIVARQRWFTLLGTLGGKWPHTQAIEPGGTTRAIDQAESRRLLAKVREFRAFLETELFAAPLEFVSGLQSLDELWAWHDAEPTRGDFRFFLGLAKSLDLLSMGKGPGRYLSNGAYPQPDATCALAPGVWDANAQSLQPINSNAITEDVTHAWMAQREAQLHPASGETRPDPDKEQAYSWNKAPRLAGEVIETGAIARQLANANQLVREAVATHGSTVFTRVLARVSELAIVVPMMEQWLASIQPGEPFCNTAEMPDTASAVGLSEAARGALGHWVSVEHGNITNYQIIAPTTWNFSPRDQHGTPGALEQALVGATVRNGEKTPVAVQHIVRSFDPCMVCTVH